MVYAGLSEKYRHFPQVQDLIHYSKRWMNKIALQTRIEFAGQFKLLRYTLPLQETLSEKELHADRLKVYFLFSVGRGLKDRLP